MPSRSYQETLDYMFYQLPMYQRVGTTAFKKNLDNIIALCEHLGNPHTKFKSIHIGGTNGKGSSSHMLAAILQTEGYKTGLYTSPHLKNFTERIRVNGSEIHQEAVVDFIDRCQDVIEQISPSFFEITVAMAFDYFAQQQVDYAVVEVGLGGRLDSTNILSPEACLITNISFDHQEILGDTLAKIAYEKAGIFKANTPAIISEKHPETAPVFQAESQLKNAPLSFAGNQFSIQNQHVFRENQTYISDLSPALKGEHQEKNILGVIQIADQLQISKKSIQHGIEHATELTGLKGRWQQLGTQPLTLCDVGHNEAGVQMILQQIRAQEFNQLHMVWGMVKGKAHEKILNMLPKEATYYFCQPQVPRGLDVTALHQAAQEAGLKGQAYASVKEAIEEAQQHTQSDDLIFIGGSTFVIAEIEDL